MASGKNRELVTLVECISAHGVALEPMVIIKAKSIIERWCIELPDGYLLATSDSAYNNDELALSWLKHFNKNTHDNRKGRWRVLLMDSHTSHLT
ncbi:hypothetical protein P154DRAFT_441071, partial [Amniculicola lignicola CBS 123094]